MIIKGQARGRGRQLAAHLLRSDQNERIQLHECRYTVAQDVRGALDELEALGAASRCKRPLYHASISPAADRPLNSEQLIFAVDALEAKLGLKDQPRVVVIHRKSGREHVHVAWSRIEVERGRAISDSWNYRTHEEVARELERKFGHEPVIGAFTRPEAQPRPRRTPKTYEMQQAARSGVKPDDVRAELTALWRSSQTGAEFQAALNQAGYLLARGDHRVFVVLDRAGEAHSLTRRIDGAKAKDIRAKLADLNLGEMPSVSQAREFREERRRALAVQVVSHTCAPVATAISDHSARPRKCGKRYTSQICRAAIFNGRAEYAALLTFYAAKIAAVYLCAAKHEVNAMVAAIRLEERAALRALRARQAVQFLQGKGKRRAWDNRLASYEAKLPEALKPQRRGRAYRRKLPSRLDS
jgi:hypothetical protein